jgi:hypothetical protein
MRGESQALDNRTRRQLTQGRIAQVITELCEGWCAGYGVAKGPEVSC